MRKFSFLAFILSGLFFWVNHCSLFSAPSPFFYRGFSVVEKTGEKISPDIEIYNEQGVKVRLSDLLKGLPSILTLVYYRCPGTCTLILNALAESLESLRHHKIGTDYRIITLSFDPTDTPAMASQKKQSYLKRFPLPGNLRDGWLFLTASAHAIQKITEETGYPLLLTEGEYLHPSVLIFLSPDGEIRRYLYGISYKPQDLLLALFDSGMTPHGLNDYFKKTFFQYRNDLKTYTLSPLWIRGLAFMGLGVIFLLLIYAMRVYRSLSSSG